MKDEQVSQGVDDLSRVQFPLYSDRETLPAVFIQDVQCSKGMTVLRPMVNKVI